MAVRAEPTEVIASWIPHDARWADQARAAALEGPTQVREYVTGLVVHRRNGGTALTSDFDLATLGAVVEDLGIEGLSAVTWTQVQRALIPRRL